MMAEDIVDLPDVLTGCYFVSTVYCQISTICCGGDEYYINNQRHPVLP